jgi:hypothetical protein
MMNVEGLARHRMSAQVALHQGVTPLGTSGFSQVLSTRGLDAASTAQLTVTSIIGLPVLVLSS